MSSTPATQMHPPRLSLSAAILGLALIAAMVFASAFSTPPTSEPTPGNPQAHGQHEMPGTQESHPMQTPADAVGPNYFAGGLWSQDLGLGALAESMLLTAQPTGNVVCHTVSWHDGALRVTDVSPLHTLPAEGDDPDAITLAVVSVDHAGPDISPEFAVAIQAHVTTLAEAQKLIVFTPLPGSDNRPENEFPYDWYFLYLNERTQIVDWGEVTPLDDIDGFPGSGYFKAWLTANVPNFPMFDDGQAQGLADAINATDDPAAAAQAKWTLNTLASPYIALPLVDLAPADAMLLRRVYGVHANDAIAQAVTAEDPSLRAAAARTIGDLPQRSTAPIARLTLLAEDSAMQVRYEALVACRKIGGRQAAGVAQLVESYPMDDAMQAYYADATIDLLAFGDPIPANSRAGVLRRMPIDVLLLERRDAVSCAILLERSDLPNDLIPQIVNQLGEAQETPALTALIALLATMNPSTLAQREPLLQTLVDWDRQALAAQSDPLARLTAPDNTPKLRTAAAGALIRALPPQAVIDKLGLTTLVFEGLAWVTDPAILNPWAQRVLLAAFNNDANRTDEQRALQIAALDAIKHLPAGSINAQTVQSLLTIARNAEQVELRFAAIRAVNALPANLMPDDIDDLVLTSLTIRAIPGEMRYDLATLTAVAGRPVELTLVNPDAMEHNLVITRPGRGAAIGLEVTSMSAEDAVAIGYIPPNNDAILFHTQLVAPGTSDTLRFIAPQTPGSYDYVCTFPGHYTKMYGVLEIVAP